MPPCAQRLGAQRSGQWLVADVDADPQIDVGLVGKVDPAVPGVSLSAGASDGSRPGKSSMKNMLTDKMKTVRAYDLNLVDRSDFIVAHLVPDVASWGSAEEIVTAVREKKPVFISMEGGKSKTPLWMLGMLPHKFIYNNLDEVIEMLYAIDNGSKPIDSDRWRLLRKEYR